MTNLTEQTARGQMVEAMLTNPEFARMFEGARQSLFRGIEAMAPDEAKTREFIFAALRTLPLLETVMRTVANDGVMAAQTIARLAREAEAGKVLDPLRATARPIKRKR